MKCDIRLQYLAVSLSLLVSPWLSRGFGEEDWGVGEEMWVVEEGQAGLGGVAEEEN